jgi:hypothetical protein
MIDKHDYEELQKALLLVGDREYRFQVTDIDKVFDNEDFIYITGKIQKEDLDDSDYIELDTEDMKVEEIEDILIGGLSFLDDKYEEKAGDILEVKEEKECNDIYKLNISRYKKLDTLDMYVKDTVYEQLREELASKLLAEKNKEIEQLRVAIKALNKVII